MISASPWPNAIDVTALCGFTALAFGLPALGYVFMVLDIRAYLRSLHRSLVCVKRRLQEVPGWARVHTPRCIAALGLEVPCTEEDLKRAYRERVKHLHPDRGGDRRKFMTLQACFEEALPLLSDPQSPYRPRAQGSCGASL